MKLYGIQTIFRTRTRPRMIHLRSQMVVMKIYVSSFPLIRSVILLNLVSYTPLSRDAFILIWNCIIGRASGYSPTILIFVSCHVQNWLQAFQLQSMPLDSWKILMKLASNSVWISTAINSRDTKLDV